VDRKTKVVIHGVKDAAEVPGLAAVADDAEFLCTDSVDSLRAALPGSPVVLGWNFRANELTDAWDAAGDLRWIHWAGAGVDTVLFPGLVESGVTLTDARGIFDQPMAEYVLGLLIAMAKGFPHTFAAQARREWSYRLTERIEGADALVVGVGSIGRAIARTLRAVGMRVRGVGRSARGNDSDFGPIHGIAELDSLLGEADFVVLVTPLTNETRGLFSAERFACMKPTARLINVGRGALIDESALVEALGEKHIKGAALDVFHTEPLPHDSPLWSLENLIVSPHMSGDCEGYSEAMAEQFMVNFRRYRAGEPLLNLVDKTLGFVASA
jgi:phosphoglycerate dehydrogenase-like enzyme